MTNDPIDITSFGAQGDGASDDRAAIILALASAMAHGLPLYFPDGTYAISGSIDIYGARNLNIYGSGNATLLNPSDNTALVADRIAFTSPMARSALLMRHCPGTLIERLRFQGGESRDIDVANVGSRVYEGLASRQRSAAPTNCSAVRSTERILNVQEKHGDGNLLDADHIPLMRDAKELRELNPILERLDRCSVPRPFVTNGMVDFKGSRFLNVLWVRHLGPRYKGSLLGDLLERLGPGSKVPVPIYRRPGSYRLM